MLVDADFPGGNIEVVAVRDDTVRVRPALRDTDRNWFYWYFRVRQAAGRMITVQFTAGPVFPSNGPSASVDGGRTWTRVTPGEWREAAPNELIIVGMSSRDVFKGAVSAGVVLDELHEIRRSLEDVYMEAVGGSRERGRTL